MKLQGRFRIYDARGNEIASVKNMITNAGAAAFLAMLAQGDASIVAKDSNYYVGFCGPTVTVADTLASISTEPSGNGYARQAILRNSTGFPTIGTVNGVYRAQSLIVTWTASGGNFSQAMSRLFLTSASAGTTGTLFAYSGALTSPVTVVNGASYSARYELYIN